MRWLFQFFRELWHVLPRYPIWFWACCTCDNIHSSQRGTKPHLKKIQSHLKSQFPPEMMLLKPPAKTSVLPKIRCPVHSHVQFMPQKVFKMTEVKLTIGRLLMITIYWYQLTQKVYTFWFVYTFTSGWFDHRSYDQTTLIRMYKEVRKLHLKIYRDV